jgi:hypothetical protein
MHHAAIVDRGARRLQRLSQHLAPEYLGTAGVAALAAEQVDLEPFELELLLKIGEAPVHQPNLKAPFMIDEWPGKLQKKV